MKTNPSTMLTSNHFHEKLKIDYPVINIPCFMDSIMTMHDEIHDQQDFDKNWEEESGHINPEARSTFEIDYRFSLHSYLFYSRPHRIQDRKFYFSF